MQKYPKWFKDIEVNTATTDVGFRQAATMIVPSYVVKDISEWVNIPQYLKFFARKAFLVHVPSALYNSLSKNLAKEGIRAVSAHNDKLGFDWRKVDEKWWYVQDTKGRHFAASQYPAFI